MSNSINFNYRCVFVVPYGENVCVFVVHCGEKRLCTVVILALKKYVVFVSGAEECFCKGIGSMSQRA